MPDTPARPPTPVVDSPAPATPRHAHFDHGRRAFRTLTQTHGYEALEIEGELPAGLRGTLVRNGPGAYESFDRRYGHWFDGDGAISAVRIHDGQAEGAVRFVDSDDRQAEREAGRMLKPNFGTRAPSLRSHLRSLKERRIKQAANTNVIGWRGQLLALHEGSLPVAVDPDTLDTLGTTDLGVLGTAMSAHPHRVAARACTYNFGLTFEGRPAIDLFALPDVGAPRKLTRIPLKRSMMVHDFIATDRHLIFLLAPVVLRPLLMALTGRSYVESLAWRPELGTEVVLVPIDAPERVRRFCVDPVFTFHFANAFETDGAGGENSDLIVDFVRYPDFPTINRWLTELIEPGPVTTAIDGTLVRARISPKSESLTCEALLESCEFPRLAPAVEGQRHRYCYLAGHAQTAGVRPGVQDHLVKLDMDTGAKAVWDFGAETYPSEPVFVPDPARAGREDGGWIVTMVYEGERDRSGLAVVDAEAPERGVLGWARFDHHLPPTFHGNWIEGR